MSMDPALVALLTQSVTLATVASRSSSGQAVWSAASSAIPARIEQDRREILSASGQTVVTNHAVYLDGTASPIPVPGARIWLPGDSGAASAREIQQVIIHPDIPPGTGVNHYEVLV